MNDLIGVSPELLGSVSFGGLRAHGLGYAVDSDNDGTIYLSMVGYRTAVRAVWAALMNNDAIELGDQLFRRLEGNYLSRTVQLPECGLDHMVLLHHQAAIPHLEPDKDFYVLDKLSDSVPTEATCDRFFSMLDRATVTPLMHSWAAELWIQGIKSQLIKPMTETRGVAAWTVSADSDLWLGLIRQGIQDGSLSTGEAQTHE